MMAGTNNIESLTAQEVAQLLRLPIKTVYELAKAGIIPGKKYGKQWRFFLSDVIDGHRGSAVLAIKEDSDGGTTPKGQSSLYDRHLLPHSSGKSKTIAPYSWDGNNPEGGAKPREEAKKRG